MYFLKDPKNDIFRIGVAISDNPKDRSFRKPSIKAVIVSTLLFLITETVISYVYFGGLWGGQLHAT